jgi:hypothetical protein
MIEVVVLVPVADNDAVTFPPAWHSVFEAKLLALFGGFSKLPSNVLGQWVGDGATYTDETRAYVIAIKSIANGAEVGEAVAFAKAHYRQEAIFIRYLGVAEIL